MDDKRFSVWDRPFLGSIKSGYQGNKWTWEKKQEARAV